MSLYRITTAQDDRPNPEVIADDEVEALSIAVIAGALQDDDEGNIERGAIPFVEPYIPEGPG
jgi:hypothetical protein